MLRGHSKIRTRCSPPPFFCSSVSPSYVFLFLHIPTLTPFQSTISRITCQLLLLGFLAQRFIFCLSMFSGSSSPCESALSSEGSDWNFDFNLFQRIFFSRLTALLSRLSNRGPGIRLGRSFFFFPPPSPLTPRASLKNSMFSLILLRRFVSRSPLPLFLFTLFTGEAVRISTPSRRELFFFL